MGEIKTVGVVGAGTMGHGLAQTLAQAGYKVILFSRTQKTIDAALDKIKKNLEKFWVAKGKITEKESDEILAKIRVTTNLEDIKDVDLVIESVAENMEVKQEIFKKLDELCRDDVILFTNTSGLSITKIAAATKRPQKVVGTHFSNPVQVMRRFEIVKGLQTSEETIAVAKEIGIKLGKAPRVTKKDYPGFIGNRLVPLWINEAFNIVDQGVASAEDVDEGMKEGLGHPMGPLETADLIGLDVELDISESLYREYGEKFRPSPLLRKLVEAGYLGRKTGRGVYDYSEGVKKPWLF